MQVFDTLKLHEEGSNTPLMELSVTGVGVHPQVDVSLGRGEELALDMGHAMAKDVISKTFTLYNSSPLKVRYLISMETQLPRKRPSKSFSECSEGAGYCIVCGV